VEDEDEVLDTIYANWGEAVEGTGGQNAAACALEVAFTRLHPDGLAMKEVSRCRICMRDSHGRILMILYLVR
jgi:hypothetical protein